MHYNLDQKCLVDFKHFPAVMGHKFCAFYVNMNKSFVRRILKGIYYKNLHLVCFSASIWVKTASKISHRAQIGDFMMFWFLFLCKNKSSHFNINCRFLSGSHTFLVKETTHVPAHVKSIHRNYSRWVKYSEVLLN